LGKRDSDVAVRKKILIGLAFLGTGTLWLVGFLLGKRSRGDVHGGDSGGDVHALQHAAGEIGDIATGVAEGTDTTGKVSDGLGDVAQDIGKAGDKLGDLIRQTGDTVTDSERFGRLYAELKRRLGVAEQETGNRPDNHTGGGGPGTDNHTAGQGE